MALDEWDILLKRLANSSLKEAIEQMKHTDQKNNSFVYLDSKTIHLLLSYLIANVSNNKTVSTSHDTIPIEVLEELEQSMDRTIDTLNNLIAELTD